MAGKPVEPEYRKLGQTVKRLREKAGLSQDDVAKLMDLSRVSITNIEAGRQRVNYALALRILRKLRVARRERCSACGAKLGLKPE